MKAEILIRDPLGRWEQGDIGVLMDNDYPEKYDYLVSLGDGPTTEVFGTTFTVHHVYYFQSDEIQLLED